MAACAGVVADAPAVLPGAMAEFSVFAVEEESFVEKTEAFESLPADKHERAADPIDIAGEGFSVPAGLVEIGPGEDAGDKPGESEAVGGESRRSGESPRRVLNGMIGIEEHATHDADGRIILHLLDAIAQDVGFEDGVAVEKEDELGAGVGLPEGFDAEIAATGKTAIDGGRHKRDPGPSVTLDGGAEKGDGVVAGGVVDEDDAGIGDVLNLRGDAGEAVEGHLRGAIVDDDDAQAHAPLPEETNMGGDFSPDDAACFSTASMVHSARRRYQFSAE